MFVKGINAPPGRTVFVRVEAKKVQKVASTELDAKIKQLESEVARLQTLSRSSDLDKATLAKSNKCIADLKAQIEGFKKSCDKANQDQIEANKKIGQQLEAERAALIAEYNDKNAGVANSASENSRLKVQLGEDLAAIGQREAKLATDQRALEESRNAFAEEQRQKGVDFDALKADYELRKKGLGELETALTKRGAELKRIEDNLGEIKEINDAIVKCQAQKKILEDCLEDNKKKEDEIEELGKDQSDDDPSPDCLNDDDMKKYTKLYKRMIDACKSAEKIMIGVENKPHYKEDSIRVLTKFFNLFKDFGFDGTDWKTMCNSKGVFDATVIGKQLTNKMCKKVKGGLKNEKAFEEVFLEISNKNEDVVGAVRVYVRIKACVNDITNKMVCVRDFWSDDNESLKYNKYEYGTTMTTIDNPEFVSDKETPNIQKQIQGLGLVNKGEEMIKFSAVFDETMNNTNVFKGDSCFNNPNNKSIEKATCPSIESVFKQVLSGYSIVLFGYGLSGSGKTYTLIGNTSTPGVLLSGLTFLIEKNVEVFVHQVFELEVGEVTLLGSGNFSDKITSIVEELKEKESTKYVGGDNIEALDKKDGKSVYLDKVTNTKDLQTFVDTITEHRKTRKRIAESPNNKESSRSHLFMVFRVELGAKKEPGYFTIVDMGGRENPEKIYGRFAKVSSAGKGHPEKVSENSYYSSTLTTFIKDGKAGYKKDHSSDKSPYRPATKSTGKEYDGEDVLALLKTGMFINETISHLQYFLKRKSDPQYNNTKKLMPYDKSTKTYVYNSDNVFVKPGTTDVAGDATLKLTKITKILNHLDTLVVDEQKTTKFVMICCVRQEEKYRLESINTVGFAESIKSAV